MGARLSSPGRIISPALRRNPRYLRFLQPQPGRRVPKIPGPRPDRNHQLRGHPRVAAAARQSSTLRARRGFGRDARGIWLPECAYAAGIGAVLQEANIRWFIMDTHGILHARPRPRYGVFAPVFTPEGIAAFGRDLESAKQVWSRQ